MAESAANFTFTTQNKPSIFEVIAQKSLNDTLHPALRRVALNFEGRFKKFLLRSHSIFEVTWTLITIYNYLRYMSGGTDAQLPMLRLIHLKLVYGDPEPEAPSFWSALFKGQLLFPQSGMLKTGVANALSVMAFFLQFLQAWNSQKSNYNITALPVVEAPQFDNKSSNYQNRCPLCLQQWKIPTVLPVSGYVFCFPCIMRYLREHQKCPVTNLPAKPLDVVRLYDGE